MTGYTPPPWLWPALLATGLLSLSAWPQLPPGEWALAIVPVVLLSWRWPRLLWLGLPLTGAALGWLWAQQQLERQWPEAWFATDLVARGQVVGLPLSDQRRQRFQFAVQQWQTVTGKPLSLPPQTVQLSWYHRGQGAAEGLRPGQHWRLRVRLRPVRGFANPHGFDYRAWQLRRGIQASGYVRTDDGNRQSAAATDGVDLDRWRLVLAEALAQTVPKADTQGLLRALLVGDKQGISEAQWQVLSATGTNHLLVISGLHVGLVATLALALGHGLGRLLRRPQGARWLPVVLALLACGGYAALAGFSLPTQRALVMVTVLLLALAARRAVAPWTGFSWALLAVALLDPLAATSAGFWLSFGAVAALIAVFSGRGHTGGRWWRAQWAVFIGLLPLLVATLGQFAPLAPLVNLLAIPWIGLTVVPPLLLGGLLFPLWPAGADGLWQLASWTLEWGWWMLAQVAQWQGGPQWLPAPPTWALLLALCGVVWLLRPPGWPARWLGLILLLPVLAPVRSTPPALSLTVLDVGQGLATVVRTREHSLVIDLGPRYSPRFEAGGDMLWPYLRAEGVTRLDRIIASHGDLDHAGGLPGLLAHLPAPVISGEADELQAQGMAARPCQAGQQWQWDGVRFRILHPPAEHSHRGNNASCVVQVSLGDTRILLPGDIEATVERRLLPQLDPLTVLVAPHHGSRSSSSTAFVAATAPRWVIFAHGYRHHFGHPHPDVVARYRAQDSTLRSTANGGAQYFAWDGDGRLIEHWQWRQRRQRWWHARENPEP